MADDADTREDAPQQSRWEHYQATGHANYETSYEHDAGGITTCTTCHAEVKG